MDKPTTSTATAPSESQEKKTIPEIHQPIVVYNALNTLKPGARDWIIQARCTQKSKIIPYVSKGNPGNRMTFAFQEAESGMKIAAVTFNEHIKTLDHAIVEGKNYAISKATVQTAYGNPAAGYHACQLLLYKHSKVELLQDAENYVASDVLYSPLKQLEAGDLDVGATINVLAILQSVGSMQNMEFKKEDGSPREAKYLKAQLTDPSLTPEDDGIAVTFWNENAAAVRRYSPGTPMELKSVQVNDWEGRLCLKATGVSEIKMDPQTPKAADLVTWYAGGRKRRSTE